MARSAKTEVNASEKDLKEKVTPAEKENTGVEMAIPAENENTEKGTGVVTENQDPTGVENENPEAENKIEEESTEPEEKDTYISVRKKPWADLQDNKYKYKQGDVYPREGLEVSEERIKELSGINNKLGEVLIQKVEKNKE
ncbi:MAG: hypothetical protein IJH12_06900 [Clostridia bacterium]|nr:hypothetical protein [Clostridia bacterium]